MIKVTLPDGSVKEMAQGVTPMDVAKSISEGLARNVISASYNGTTIETTTTLTTDGTLILFTWNDVAGKKAFWHSTSHVMAQALEELYPGIKLTLGPAIDNGFYYDVDFGDQKITDADFKKIEDRVLEISREKHEFKMRPVSKAEALEVYKNNEYKTELISNLEDGTITFCDHANFFDLCRGGHIPNTGIIKAMKILSVAGAYWRGDEKNKQLTRVYGISFPKQKDLTDYLELLEEAKKRYPIGTIFISPQNRQQYTVTLYKNNVSLGVLYSVLTGTMYICVGNNNALFSCTAISTLMFDQSVKN